MKERADTLLLRLQQLPERPVSDSSTAFLNVYCHLLIEICTCSQFSFLDGQQLLNISIPVQLATILLQRYIFSHLIQIDSVPPGSKTDWREKRSNNSSRHQPSRNGAKSTVAKSLLSWYITELIYSCMKC
jgi:hypothetical protein